MAQFLGFLRLPAKSSIICLKSHENDVSGVTMFSWRYYQLIHTTVLIQRLSLALDQIRVFLHQCGDDHQDTLYIPWWWWNPVLLRYTHHYWCVTGSVPVWRCRGGWGWWRRGWWRRRGSRWRGACPPWAWGLTQSTSLLQPRQCRSCYKLKTLKIDLKNFEKKIISSNFLSFVSWGWNDRVWRFVLHFQILSVGKLCKSK